LPGSQQTGSQCLDDRVFFPLCDRSDHHAAKLRRSARQADWAAALFRTARSDEGHCDERGYARDNLDARASATP